ncbi:ion transporter [Paraburkholderia acidiphila]|uniref:Ion transporter n=1 Tax=Paraburkholderia acidiphila TaxID=2571747 RepID=A0A7Z2G8N2_9BURK|nr:ion transporter [Paraburkholderia acidiphila]QGZ57070.1 ion transporter [Paraburkholderia acidiphila]
MNVVRPLKRDFGRPDHGWRRRMYAILVDAETDAARHFNAAMLSAIIFSVAVVMLDSVEAVRARELLVLDILEWFFTLLFTAEYIVRLLCVERPLRYALSFFGIIDLVSILPTYLGLLLPGFHVLVDVRLLRMLRIFRIVKLPLYFNESQVLWRGLVRSRHRIMVFLGVVLILIVVLGTVMYLVEGPSNGFTSIPVSMYWAVVTMTTTGYGDIHPKTALGQFITSLAMLLGYGVIAFPAAMIGAEAATATRQVRRPSRVCLQCHSEGHDADATYCRHCGEPLPPVDAQ